MKKTILVGFSMLIVIAMLLPTVFAFEYGNPAHPDNTDFETFGPRCDNLLIQLYASETAEWDALEAHEIDVTDWPLDAEHYTDYSTPPMDADIKVISYGPEFGLFLFDLNMNNNEFLGNPEDPAYPNPVYPNPMSCECLRMAIAYLSDRTYVINEVIGEGFAFPVYTPMSPASGFYVHSQIRPGGLLEELCYLYNLEKAQVALFGAPVTISATVTYLNGSCINLEAASEVQVLAGVVRNRNTGALLVVEASSTRFPQVLCFALSLMLRFTSLLVRRGSTVVAVVAVTAAPIVSAAVFQLGKTAGDTGTRTATASKMQMRN